MAGSSNAGSLSGKAGHESDVNSSYPPLYVVGPASGHHKQTFILLHGRGDSGEAFGAYLTLTHIPDHQDLQTVFPDTKFVFPTASPRIVSRFPSEKKWNQYFDIWSLIDPDERDEIQLEGLRESTAYVHRLLRSEIEKVGAANVAIWGLSQGCAIMFTSLLLWTGPQFAAAIGMCGWLPLWRRMSDAVAPSFKDDDEGEHRADAKSKFTAAVACLSQLIGENPALKVSKVSGGDIPLFLGHGALDGTVSINLGRQAAGFLQTLGFNVEWSEYATLGHWYSGKMLSDIIDFLHHERFGNS